MNLILFPGDQKEPALLFQLIVHKYQKEHLTDVENQVARFWNIKSFKKLIPYPV